MPTKKSAHHRFVLMLLIGILSGCAPPTAKSVIQFSESTVGVASIAGSAVQLDTDVQSRTNTIKAANILASGRVPPFPPSPGVLVDGRLDQLWEERTFLLKAMTSYATTLAQAADPSLSDGIIDAASNLSVAISDFSAARAARVRDERKRAIAIAEAQRVGAIGNVIVAIGDYAIDLVVAAKIKQVTTAMHPVLEQTRDTLKADLFSLGLSIRQKRNSLAIALGDKLRIHASDPRLSTVDKFGLYISAVDELAIIDGRVEVVANFGQVLDAMVQAHTELRDSATDKRALADFLAAIRNIATKIDAYQDIENKLKELRRL